MKRLLALLCGALVTICVSSAHADQPTLKDTYMALQAAAYAAEFLVKGVPVVWENPDTGRSGTAMIVRGDRNAIPITIKSCLTERNHVMTCSEFPMVQSHRGWVNADAPQRSIGVSVSVDPDQKFRAACFRAYFDLDVPGRPPFPYQGTICKTGREQWRVMP